MRATRVLRFLSTTAVFSVVAFTLTNASAADQIVGQVTGANKPIAMSKVTLWSAGPRAPKKVAETQADADGRFNLSVGVTGADEVLYFIARGGEPSGGASNDSIALLAILGTSPLRRVIVNELTTIASVWTAAQFFEDPALKGNLLGLRIASGNVPNLVSLETGGLGPVIQDALNGSQTSTLATFSTLGDLLVGCIRRVKPDACAMLFALTAPPGGAAPSDTLTAALNIARNPANQAQKLFTLLDAFYPVPPGKLWRAAPFIPYLNYAPSAWTLSLVYSGGGMNSLGGIAIDGEGNMWSDNNFLVGAQSTIYSSFGGGISKNCAEWATSFTNDLWVSRRRHRRPRLWYCYFCR
jgi:hypothetical protein